MSFMLKVPTLVLLVMILRLAKSLRLDLGTGGNDPKREEVRNSRGTIQRPTNSVKFLVFSQMRVFVFFLSIATSSITRQSISGICYAETGGPALRPLTAGRQDEWHPSGSWAEKPREWRFWKSSGSKWPAATGPPLYVVIPFSGSPLVLDDCAYCLIVRALSRLSIHYGLDINFAQTLVSYITCCIYLSACGIFRNASYFLAGS
ncbi:hypothetical protein BKA65DRAFT_199435 [Rhexocercosporidium sp. MPI-PUGE-AT-0058]|nr:hypothetical protein BKA65DRAFT_199435 [Rhexocercosporidium sp. MPI-PUGE-AT-0058]